MSLCVVLCEVVFYVIWRSENVNIPKFSPWKTVKVFTAEDRSSPNFTYNLKILLSFLQIATSLMSFVSIPWYVQYHAVPRLFACSALIDWCMYAGRRISRRLLITSNL